MQRTTERRYRIVVAIDQSEYAEIVIEHAIDQAARHSRPDIHFVTVVPHISQVGNAKSWLAVESLGALETLGVKNANWRSWVHVHAGDPTSEIVGLAADLRADLLVIGCFGTHDPRGRATFTRKVLEAATCPTLVVTLKDYGSDDDECEACVAVRAETEAERLFCDEHASDRPLRTERFTWSTGHGGPLL